jgi:hypothetical protein
MEEKNTSKEKTRTFNKQSTAPNPWTPLFFPIPLWNQEQTNRYGTAQQRR